MEDIDVRRAMQSSDLPKLSERFGNGERFGKIAWNVMKERVAWGIQKFKWKRIEEIRNDDNPLISLFTWTVMVPVGGTFCIFAAYRKKVRVNHVAYAMNQCQKKAFLNKMLKKNTQNELK